MSTGEIDTADRDFRGDVRLCVCAVQYIQSIFDIAIMLISNVILVYNLEKLDT